MAHVRNWQWLDDDDDATLLTRIVHCFDPHAEYTAASESLLDNVNAINELLLNDVRVLRYTVAAILFLIGMIQIARARYRIARLFSAAAAAADVHART